ncbi:MAG: TOBE domain-containing protein [Candidatus Dactylopiibacterium sp.]|nr:TOBE domain-containing protein [Candidatus Dactylopiibacterium sp.]
MPLSARNAFSGRVSALALGPVSAEVEITCAGGDRFVATITTASARALHLAPGVAATAIVDASGVMLATGADGGASASARNRLEGIVAQCVTGPVSAEVALRLAGGGLLHASLTHDAVRRLALGEGTPATALIKASAIMVGVTS